MTRDPFPDHAAFRRLEDVARGAYDPRPTTDDRRPRRRWTASEWLLVGLLIFGEVALGGFAIILFLGGGR